MYALKGECTDDRYHQVNWNGRDIQVRSPCRAERSDSSSPLIVAAKVDNRIRELTYKVEQDCRLSPDLPLEGRRGPGTLSACLRELYRECSVTVEHFGGGCITMTVSL